MIESYQVAMQKLACALCATEYEGHYEDLSARHGIKNQLNPCTLVFMSHSIIVCKNKDST